jgi:hypothetical protein
LGKWLLIMRSTNKAAGDDDFQWQTAIVTNHGFLVSLRHPICPPNGSVHRSVVLLATAFVLPFLDSRYEKGEYVLLDLSSPRRRSAFGRRFQNLRVSVLEKQASNSSNLITSQPLFSDRA